MLEVVRRSDLSVRLPTAKYVPTNSNISIVFSLKGYGKIVQRTSHSLKSIDV